MNKKHRKPNARPEYQDFMDDSFEKRKRSERERDKARRAKYKGRASY